MKNKMSDVRDHLVVMLEQLGDPEVKAEVVERAKATAMVAGQYIAAVKVEMDALRLADEIGCVPTAIDAPAAQERHDEPPITRARNTLAIAGRRRIHAT